MSLNYKSIGKHIREIRQRNHLSQAMLSELVDKTPSYISYIESGIKSMSLDTFVLIANALGVSPDQLLLEQITCSEQCASEEITLLLSDCTTYEMLMATIWWWLVLRRPGRLRRSASSWRFIGQAFPYASETQKN